ncbi:MAG: hypothetical protein M9962_10090 [Oligoflexia bacterium]|nr:hypothetical protein [Oligoflexia bacterium]
MREKFKHLFKEDVSPDLKEKILNRAESKLDQLNDSYNRSRKNNLFWLLAPSVGLGAVVLVLLFNKGKLNTKNEYSTKSVAGVEFEMLEEMPLLEELAVLENYDVLKKM